MAENVKETTSIKKSSPKKRSWLPKKKSYLAEDGSGHTLVSQDSPFAIKEAYKYTRTNLLFSLASQPSKVVVVSSALPGEGKSTTCCNTALTLAQTGSHVLLVDSDMRKPVQHKIFQKPNQKGLADLLGGFAAAEDVLFRDVADKLDLITAGTIPPNPSELLGSENMRIFLETAGKSYDYVLIDSPPINLVSDAIVLANMAAGIVLVTRQGYCTYRDLQQAVESIKFTGANILGMVVNETGQRGGRYGGKGYSSKGYYGGYEEKENKT